MSDFITPEVMEVLLTAVIIPLLGLVTKYAVALLKRKITELEQKIDNEAARKYLGLAENAIEAAVISVNQTFVDALKKQGAFDEAAMVKAFNLAKQMAVSMIGESAREALKLVFGDVDAWLDSKIEYYVNRTK